MFTKLLKFVAPRFFYREMMEARIAEHQKFVQRAAELQATIGTLITTLEADGSEQAKRLAALMANYSIALVAREAFSRTVIRESEIALMVETNFNITPELLERSSAEIDLVLQQLQDEISQVGHVGASALH